MNRYTNLDHQVTMSFFSVGQYSTAYRSIANELTVGSQKHTWFDNASYINAGVGPAAAFASMQTKLGYKITSIPQVDPQIISKERGLNHE